LSGKYLPGVEVPAESRAASDSMGGYMQSLLRPEMLKAVQMLKPLAEQAECTLSQFALAWVLRLPNVASGHCWRSRPEQLEENAVASGLFVEPELFKKAEAVVAAVSR
jgi:aryl-alcohol dehydrogenase-like predicted oxidoreductase